MLQTAVLHHNNAQHHRTAHTTKTIKKKTQLLSFAIISLVKRELVALLVLCSEYHATVIVL